MYKVFVNEAPLILTKETREWPGLQRIPEDADRFLHAVAKLYDGSWPGAVCPGVNPTSAIVTLNRALPAVRAAGGVVTRPDGTLLFIFRNGRWDLPKGKLEKGESIGEGALREVEEETGVSGLRLGPLLRTTYHVFKRNDRFRLKVTDWFAMTTSYDGPLQAQEEEGITEVAWLDAERRTIALGNTYANIRLLLEGHSFPD